MAAARASLLAASERSPAPSPTFSSKSSLSSPVAAKRRAQLLSQAQPLQLQACQPLLPPLAAARACHALLRLRRRSLWPLEPCVQLKTLEAEPQGTSFLLGCSAQAKEWALASTPESFCCSSARSSSILSSSCLPFSLNSGQRRAYIEKAASFQMW